jgi:S-methylmethionine-dependent homocysteine/selenocysteine methylase
MVGSSTNMLGAWSATANVEAPDVVQQIHADYMRVGADIVTTNTVFTTPTRMAVASR